MNEVPTRVLFFEPQAVARRFGNKTVSDRFGKTRSGHQTFQPISKIQIAGGRASFGRHCRKSSRDIIIAR